MIRKSCVIETKNYTAEEKFKIINEYSELIGKKVVLLKIEEANYLSQRDKLKVVVGTIEGVEWSEFQDYAVISLKLQDRRGTIRVHALRWNYIMFENAQGVINVLQEFLCGNVYNLHESLNRWLHEFDNLLWTTKNEYPIKSSYALSEGNQLLRFDKEIGEIDIVKVTSIGNEWVVKPGQTFNKTQKEIYDTDKYSYYTLTMHRDGYAVDETKDFFGDVKKFIERQFSKDDEKEQSVNTSVLEDPEVCLEQQLKEVLSEVVSEFIAANMSQILEEAKYRLQKL